ncbi:MAG TPA: uroporphyrinogen decarboxylase family protein [Armatimonadota bacterium]|nr:uroporphyrinogen decarboxylase family protein [Armatimonadota bacterium]
MSRNEIDTRIQAAIEDRKKQWADFYDPNNPPRHMLLIRLTENTPARPLPHPDKKQQRIEWAWMQYLAQMKRVAWLDDDTMPHLDVYTGTEIFAEAFGCSVHRPEDNMPFALPLITEASQVSTLHVPDLDVPCLKLLFEIADELRARGGPNAVLKMVDVQSPMGIAALIWKKTSFYAAMVDQPEAVKELAAKAKVLLVAFLDEWVARYGVDFVAHCPDYYMPKGITLSEDEIGSVSPDAYYDLFHTELVELSRRYGGIGIHCCANAKHQWEGLKRIPDLRLLNLVQPPDILREAYLYFASHVPQMHSWCGEGDPMGWIAQLPKESRVVLQVSADSKKQAIDLSSRLREVMKGQTT